MLRRSAVIGLVAAVVLGVASPALALPLAPVPGTDTWVASITNYIVPDQYAAEDELAEFICEERRELPARSSSRTAALDKATALLRELAPARAMTAFEKSPIYRSKPQLEATMALGTMNGSLPAALAASLRLARLSQDPRHLINSAVLLQQADAPESAADLLAWAKERPLGMMAGVDGTAAWQSAMGGVLLQYGRFPEAQKAYEAALAREPLMATARQGIARALNCMGQAFLATKWQGRSMSIVDPLPLMADDPVEPEEPPMWSAKPRIGILDLTAGKAGPSFLPFTPPKGPDIRRGQYSGPVLTTWGEYMERNAMGTQAPFPELTPAQKALDDYLSLAIAHDPVLKDLEKESLALGEELDSIGPNSTCPAVDDFGAYWQWLGKNHRVTVKTADRVHLIATAAAAATGDPVLNTFYNAYADYLVDLVYQNYLFALAAYAGEAENQAEIVRLNDDQRQRGEPLIDSKCKTSFLNGSESGTYVADGPQGKGQDASPCSALGPLAKKDIIDISLPIPGAPVKPKLKVTCEKISLSAKFASVGGPYAEMGLFASVDYEWFTGDIVLTAGAFAELGPLNVKAGPQLRLGTDSNGNFGIKDSTYVVKPGIKPPKSARAETRGTTYLLIS